MTISSRSRSSRDWVAELDEFALHAAMSPGRIVRGASHREPGSGQGVPGPHRGAQFQPNRRAHTRLSVPGQSSDRLLGGGDRGEPVRADQSAGAAHPPRTELEERLRPAYSELVAACEAARRSAREPTGTLRVAFTVTTEGPGLTRVLDAFSRRHPDCDIALVEVSFADPYGPLRRGEVDVLYNWLAVDEPDLNTSAPLDHQARVLAVSRQDPLARQQP